MTTTTFYQIAGYFLDPLANDSIMSGDQLSPAMLSLGNGDYVVAYVNASGALAGGNLDFFNYNDELQNAAAVAVNPGHAGTMPSPIALTQLASGLVVAAWAELENDGFYHVAYEEFDKQGNAQGAAVVLAGGSSIYADVSLAATNDGGFMVSATNGFGVTAYGHVGSTGTFGGFLAGSGVGSAASDMARLNSGDVVISYSHAGNVEYDLVDGTGGLIHTATAATAASASDVIALANGGFAIAYEHTGALGGQGIDIGLSFFDASGVLVNKLDVVNQGTTGDQHAPVLGIDNNGDLIVGWSTLNGTSDTDVLVKLFDQSGNELGYDQLMATISGGAGTYAASMAVTTKNMVEFVIENSNPTDTADASGTHIGHFGGPSDATIYGDDTQETILGANGLINYIFGNGGDDTIQGRALLDGVGQDELFGHAGNDTLIAGPNGAGLEGGPGDDILFGSATQDSLRGENGNDTLYGGGAGDYMSGGDGNDILVGNSDIYAIEANDIHGDSGDDTIVAGFGDIIDGGAGIDTLIAVNSYDLNIDLALTSIEWIQAAFGNDHIDATAQAVGVTVFASGGNDFVGGSSFADMIWAGYGNDSVSGGGGDDVIVGDAGADSLFGNGGNDTIYTDGSDTLLNGGSGTDALMIVGGLGQSFDLAALQFETVIDYSGGNDTLDGALLTVDAVIFGGGGVDTITGGSGNDFLWGEAGADSIAGGIGDDTLVGGSFGDTLTGGTGNDTIFCNTGTGGDGSVDTVKFAATGWGTDFVYDFEHGIDKLNLHGSGATSGTVTLAVQGSNEVVTFGSDHIIVVGGAGTFTLSDIAF